MKTKIFFAAILIKLLVFSQCLFSQSADKIDQDQFLELSTLSLEELLTIKVNSASKQEETVAEAPSILSVFPIQQITDYGWLSIEEIMYNVPGFFRSQDYDRRTVGSRGQFEGWNNNHLLLLVDGIPFNDNQYGTAYTWEITPLLFAHSIEILRGPASALYGSNATNGVVSINTLSASDLKQKVQVGLRLGSLNYRTFDLIAGIQGKYFSSVFSYTAYQTSGIEYDSYDDSFRQGRDKDFPKKYRVQDDRSGQYVFAKIEGEKALKGLDIQYHFQYWSYKTGHGWNWMIPEMAENLNEYRNIFSVKYNSGTDSKLEQEYVLRWQEHNINWNLQESPPEAWDGYYPQGMIEYLNTTTHDIFARAQLKYNFNNPGETIIGGIESYLFLYDASDEEHFSNIVLDQDADELLWTPNINNEMQRQQPWFEWIDGEPVTTLGIYTQYSSGRIFDNLLKTVIGLRYDTQFFNFKGIDKIGDPEESRSFSKLSPRLAVIFFPAKDLVIKTLFGMAFRTPSPSEMFSANTWTLASSMREIEAETITTFEAAVDYQISSNFSCKINGYYTKFENQAAYGLGEIANITNIYSFENAGLEAELVWVLNNFSGFANYSFTSRVDEEISETQIEYIEKTDELTWAPAHLFNIGLLYKKGNLSSSLQLSYQGEVLRRESDSSPDWPEYSALRPAKIDSWISVDLNFTYHFNDYLQFNCKVKNLFDQDRYLIKNFIFPFDYKMPGRQILAGLSMSIL